MYNKINIFAGIDTGKSHVDISATRVINMENELTTSISFENRYKLISEQELDEYKKRDDTIYKIMNAKTEETTYIVHGGLADTAELKRSKLGNEHRAAFFIALHKLIKNDKEISADDMITIHACFCYPFADADDSESTAEYAEYASNFKGEYKVGVFSSELGKFENITFTIANTTVRAETIAASTYFKKALGFSEGKVPIEKCVAFIDIGGFNSGVLILDSEGVNSLKAFPASNDGVLALSKVVLYKGKAKVPEGYEDFFKTATLIDVKRKIQGRIKGTSYGPTFDKIIDDAVADSFKTIKEFLPKSVDFESIVFIGGGAEFYGKEFLTKEFSDICPNLIFPNEPYFANAQGARIAACVLGGYKKFIKVASGRPSKI